MRSPNMLCGSSMPRFGTCPGTRAETGGAEVARDRAVGRDRLDLELEDVLKLDHVGLHPQHLGDLHDPPRPVFHAVDVDEHVERCGHMLPDGPGGRS